MKRYLNAFSMCQSMFCAIPFPGKTWDEEARPLMLLFLPVVGLEIGLLWMGLGWLVRWLELPAMAGALVLCAYPYFVTGFLHLDGFMDVTDAVKSWRDLERRREILKDSHVGSFSVIAIVLLILAQFAMFACVEGDRGCEILLLIPVVSRCCSAMAVTGLRPMSTSQYAAQNIPKKHIAVLLVMLCAALVCGFALWGKVGFALVGCLAGYALALRRGYRSLDGMNGDISGYALTISELCAVAVYALI